MAEFSLWSYGYSDVGPEREVNQDTYYHGAPAVPGGRNVFYRGVSGAAEAVLVVCDGMGGHAAGEVAAEVARDTLVDRLSDSREGTAEMRLERAIYAAHEAVLRQVDGHPDRKGMGTTCVVAIVSHDKAVVGNVGDSRAYLVRGGRLSQISKDHTRAEPLLAQGVITKAQYDKHPDRSVLMKALGQKKAPAPHIETVAMKAGDTLLLCSDGVHESLDREGERDGFIEMISGQGPDKAAHTLVREAIKRDGSDNTTAVVARLMSEAGGAVVAPEVKTAAAKPPRRDPKRLLVLGLAAALVLGLAGTVLWSKLGGTPVAEDEGDASPAVADAGKPLIEPWDDERSSVKAKASSKNAAPSRAELIKSGAPQAKKPPAAHRSTRKAKASPKSKEKSGAATRTPEPFPASAKHEPTTPRPAPVVPAKTEDKAP